MKKAYRVRNWREYEAGLRDRGKPDRLGLAHRRQACELGRGPAEEEETPAVNASLCLRPDQGP